MRLQDNVGPFGQRQGDAFRQKRRSGAGNPSAQSAGQCGHGVGGLNREDRAQAGESGLSVLAVLGAGAAGGIGGHQDVVHHGAGERLHFNRFDPLVFRQVGLQDEIAVDVRTVRGNGISGRHFQDQVGRAELPAVGKYGELGSLGGVAFGHAAVHPLLDQRDLVRGEAPFVAIGRPAGLGFPGRHVVRLHRLRDRAGPRRTSSKLVIGSGATCPGRWQEVQLL